MTLKDSNFDEYIRQGEPQQKEKGLAWQTAIGLQAVDGLTPSDYLIETARAHIEGNITIYEAKARLDSYYESKPAASVDLKRTEEADKVSTRILVRANYTNVRRGIFATPGFLELFFRNLLMSDTNELKNRNLVVNVGEISEKQQKNVGEMSEKCRRNKLAF